MLVNIDRKGVQRDSCVGQLNIYALRSNIVNGRTVVPKIKSFLAPRTRTADITLSYS